MTKCEKAQEAIGANISSIKQLFEAFQGSNLSDVISNMQNEEALNDLPMKIRRILMEIRTQISRYSLHIDCIKPDSKVVDMIRVTYLELKFDCCIDPSESDADKG
jgi:Mg/Co/Ni transporter MgtE